MGNVLEMTVGLMVSSELQLADLSVVDTAKYKCNVSNSLAVELYQVSEGIDLQVLRECTCVCVCVREGEREQESDRE